MVVNFRTCKISRGARKLTLISTLIYIYIYIYNFKNVLFILCGLVFLEEIN